jgi:hypothetical protein
LSGGLLMVNHLADTLLKNMMIRSAIAATAFHVMLFDKKNQNAFKEHA